MKWTAEDWGMGACLVSVAFMLFVVSLGMLSEIIRSWPV